MGQDTQVEVHMRLWCAMLAMILPCPSKVVDRSLCNPPHLKQILKDLYLEGLEQVPIPTVPHILNDSYLES